MTENLLVKIKDIEYGPLNKRELESLIENGEFNVTDQVWLEDESEWVKADNIEELRLLFSGGRQTRTKKIMAVGSGKGGVGKTVLTASIGMSLAMLGERTVLIDADFGGANLHTCMGIVYPNRTFFDYYTLQVDSLNDILLDTPIEKLKLISGSSGILGLANPKYFQKLRLINELRNLDANYVILDLGAGSSLDIIDYFLAVDEGIVITTPEPTAIQECFDFIKICLLRKLQRTFKDEPAILRLFSIEGIANLKKFNEPFDTLLEKSARISVEIETRMRAILEAFTVRLILNMVMNPNEVKEGISIKLAAAELLSIDLDYMGYIEFDEVVHDSVVNMRPFILHNPKSRASRSLAQLVSLKMLNKSRIDSFLAKRKIKRNIGNVVTQYSSMNSIENRTICSVKCFYWDDCEYKNGGFPCTIRHLEPLFHKK